jgi:outer membrane immunogenic protein
MKRLVLAGLAVLGLGSFACAAPPAPLMNWSGFYIGGNVGYGWGIADADVNYSSPGLVPASFMISDAAELNSIIGGAQLGFNWQTAANWIFGIEADWQASAQNGDNAFPNQPYTLPPFTTGSIQVTSAGTIEWFATVRGRIGYAWDRWLLYATGGIAYGRVKMSGTVNDSGIVNAVVTLIFDDTLAFSAASTNTGWVVGAGIENALTENWSWKVEYLYLDLGSLETSVGHGPTYFNETTAVHTDFRNHIVRVGLNYKFDWPMR